MLDEALLRSIANLPVISLAVPVTFQLQAERRLSADHGLSFVRTYWAFYWPMALTAVSMGQSVETTSLDIQRPLPN